MNSAEDDEKVIDEEQEHPHGNGDKTSSESNKHDLKDSEKSNDSEVKRSKDSKKSEESDELKKSKESKGGELADSGIYSDVQLREYREIQLEAAEPRTVPLTEPRQLVEVLNHVFHMLDTNKDNVLSQTEIDMAVIDANLSPDDVQAVSVLKACFADMKDLHKEGWFAKRNGVTLADLLIFEQILMMDRQQIEREEQEQLREVARLSVRHATDALRSPKKLFANEEHPEKSINPNAIRQGIVGDCYFLAALASVAASNAPLIKWMVQKLDDHYYQVVFAGRVDAPIVVPKPTPVELALYAKASEYGIWPAVIEKAYGLFLVKYGKVKTVIPAAAADAAESVYEAFDLITGQTGHWEALPLLSNEKLKALLDSAFKEHRAVAAGTNSSKTGYTQDAKLPAQHAYSILAWNSRKEELTVRNPWGRVSDQGTALENADGVFTISLNTFRRNFVALYYEDWTPDPTIDDSDNLPFS